MSCSTEVYSPESDKAERRLLVWLKKKKVLTLGFPAWGEVRIIKQSQLQVWSSGQRWQAAITGGLAAHCPKIGQLGSCHNKSHWHLAAGWSSVVLPGFQDGCKMTQERQAQRT
jgi:hypothetical protein